MAIVTGVKFKKNKNKNIEVYLHKCYYLITIILTSVSMVPI